MPNSALLTSFHLFTHRQAARRSNLAQFVNDAQRSTGGGCERFAVRSGLAFVRANIHAISCRTRTDIREFSRHVWMP